MKNSLCGAAGRLSYILTILTLISTAWGCSSGAPSFATTGSDAAPKAGSEYQAVFLDNGQAYFGKLEKADSKYTLLKDVYYIQSQQDPATREVNIVLTKRGSELHGPDMMYINHSHILIIESVTPGSKVGQLIKEAQAKK